jgi:hypothetical protein
VCPSQDGICGVDLPDEVQFEVAPFGCVELVPK